MRGTGKHPMRACPPPPRVSETRTLPALRCLLLTNPLEVRTRSERWPGVPVGPTPAGPCGPERSLWSWLRR
jgi:hypothetical protein